MHEKKIINNILFQNCKILQTLLRVPVSLHVTTCCMLCSNLWYCLLLSTFSTINLYILIHAYTTNVFSWSNSRQFHNCNKFSILPRAPAHGMQQTHVCISCMFCVSSSVFLIVSKYNCLLSYLLVARYQCVVRKSPRLLPS